MKILDLLLQIQAIPSRSEARRLVAQGAVKLDGQPVQVWDDEVLDGKHEVLVGKRRRFEVIVQNGDKDPLCDDDRALTRLIVKECVTSWPIPQERKN